VDISTPFVSYQNRKKGKKKEIYQRKKETLSLIITKKRELCKL